MGDSLQQKVYQGILDDICCLSTSDYMDGICTKPFVFEDYVYATEGHIMVHFIEAKVNPIKGQGTTYVEYENYMDLSEPYKYSPDYRLIPFEQMVKKYGLPNPAFKHCTRELKTVPIRKFGQDYFGTNDFYQAIGIRADEFDRMNSQREELKLIYPLVVLKVNHAKIIEFWDEMPFKLEIEGYNGNCVMCWKKDFRKLALVLQEDFYHAKYFQNLESKYAYHYPNEPILDEWGDEVPIRMYRGHKTINDIAKIQVTKEEVLAINKQKEESCEAFAECGIDN